VQRLRIEPLAGVLQAAEAGHTKTTGRDADSVSKDPWYDGRRPEHAGTIVAAPRSGTTLPDGAVLRIVKRWGRARKCLPRSPLVKWLGVAAAAILLATLVALAMRPRQMVPGSSASDAGTATIDGKDVGLRLTWHSDRKTKFRVDLGIKEP
jgi:hypothetical protein